MFYDSWNRLYFQSKQRIITNTFITWSTCSRNNSELLCLNYIIFQMSSKRTRNVQSNLIGGTILLTRYGPKKDKNLNNLRIENCTKINFVYIFYGYSTVLCDFRYHWVLWQCCHFRGSFWWVFLLSTVTQNYIFDQEYLLSITSFQDPASFLTKSTNIFLLPKRLKDFFYKNVVKNFS